jgi:hypothetical protein
VIFRQILSLFWLYKLAFFVAEQYSLFFFKKRYQNGLLW